MRTKDVLHGNTGIGVSDSQSLSTPPVRRGCGKKDGIPSGQMGALML